MRSDPKPKALTAPLLALSLAMTLGAALASLATEPAYGVSAGGCGHDAIQSGVEMLVRAPTPTPLARSAEAPLAEARSAGTQPIRIVFDTSLLASSSLNPSERLYVEQSAREVARWFEATLSVIPVEGEILFAGSCVSENVDLTVDNADLLVLLSAEPTEGGAAGWGAQCVQDSFGRPLVGQLNVDPSSVDPNDVAGERIFEDLLAHELMHILGFSRHSFDRYRDGLYGPVYSQVKTTYVQNGKTVEAILTPAVLAAARAHFGCSVLVGAELEDGGGIGAAGSHWEERIYRDEIMSPTLDSVTPSARSSLTLALFEDMGWYEVEFSHATPLRWGHGEGCRFAQGRCDDPAVFSDAYFCTDTEASSCTVDGKAKAYCEILSYDSALPPHFQYFDDPTRGGLALADYCPERTAYSNGACEDPDNDPGVYRGETYAPGSLCFESSLLDVGFVPDPTLRAACHPMRCEAGELLVQVGDAWIECPAAGGQVVAPGFSGNLACPAFEAYCSVCGDGEITHAETCDDGDTLAGDGCAADCKVENGYYCSEVPSRCVFVPEPALALLQLTAVLTLALGRSFSKVGSPC